MRWQNSLLKRVCTVCSLLLPFWIALFTLGTAASYRTAILSGQPVSWGQAARWNLVGYADWALILAPVVLVLAWRFPFERKTLREVVPIHLGAMFCVTAIDACFCTVFNPFSNPSAKPAPFRELFERYFFGALTINIWLYWGVAFTALAIAYYLKFREKEIKEIQLEAQLAQAQLQALRMQLHPHFLFNTLNAIAALVHKDPEVADRMIARLSQLLRLTLENVGVQEVRLAQELEFLEQYLEIERMRFSDRLQVRMHIPPETLDAWVPYLILQPLVENAIRHGIAPRSTPGSVEVRAEPANGNLLLHVCDDGPGIFPEAKLTEGVGISSTRARLERLYGSNHQFELRNAPNGGFVVTLAVPFRLADENSDARGPASLS